MSEGWYQLLVDYMCMNEINQLSRQVQSLTNFRDHTSSSLKECVNNVFLKALKAWTTAFKGTFTINSGQRFGNYFGFKLTYQDVLHLHRRKFVWQSPAFQQILEEFKE